VFIFIYIYSFSDRFKKQYSKSLTVIFSPSDQDWLEGIIYRELVDEEDEEMTVTFEIYLGNCYSINLIIEV